LEGYSTKLDWHGEPDHRWWVELLKDGVRLAHMSPDEWKSLGATEQEVEDDAIDRAAAAATAEMWLPCRQPEGLTSRLAVLN
jgi:hypothetical protein